MLTRREFLLLPASWSTSKDTKVEQLQRDVADLKDSLSQMWAVIEKSARNTNGNNATIVEHIAALDIRVAEIERVMGRKLV